jgi:hypothetical protein
VNCVAMHVDCAPFGRSVMWEGMVLQVLGGLQVDRDFQCQRREFSGIDAIIM